MNCTILCIGNEVLGGDVVNTDAAFISSRLKRIGIEVVSTIVIADDTDIVLKTLEAIRPTCDLIITTGGLGPTKDDLTKEAICESYGFELVDEEIGLEKIKSKFTREYLEKHDIKNVAKIPKGAKVLPNEVGTASGALCEANGKYIAFMPGPYNEATTMYVNYLEPLLIELSNVKIAQRFYMVSGIYEKQLETLIRERVDETDDYIINTYLDDHAVALKAEARAKTDKEAEAIIDEKEKLFINSIEEYLYYKGPDKVSIKEYVTKYLIENQITISGAESITAGMIASAIADTPGAGNVLLGAFVTYTNQAKMSLVKVSEKTICEHSEVSEQAALEMAKGAKEALGTDVGYSVTGFAGPTGGNEFEPLGTVWACVDFKGKVYTRRYQYQGTRAQIREKAKNMVFHMLFIAIKENNK